MGVDTCAEKWEQNWMHFFGFAGGISIQRSVQKNAAGRAGKRGKTLCGTVRDEGRGGVNLSVWQKRWYNRAQRGKSGRFFLIVAPARLFRDALLAGASSA